MTPWPMPALEAPREQHRPAHQPGHVQVGDGPDADHAKLLTRCLELQLDLLLAALEPDPAATERRRPWLSARYAALSDAVDELLEHREVRHDRTAPVDPAEPVEAGHFLG